MPRVTRSQAKRKAESSPSESPSPPPSPTRTSSGTTKAATFSPTQLESLTDAQRPLPFDNTLINIKLKMERRQAITEAMNSAKQTSAAATTGSSRSLRHAKAARIKLGQGKSPERASKPSDEHKDSPPLQPVLSASSVRPSRDPNLPAGEPVRKLQRASSAVKPRSSSREINPAENPKIASLVNENLLQAAVREEMKKFVLETHPKFDSTLRSVSVIVGELVKAKYNMADAVLAFDIFQTHARTECPLVLAKFISDLAIGVEPEQERPPYRPRSRTRRHLTFAPPGQPRVFGRMGDDFCFFTN